jgi:hypothetical protein
MDEGIVDGDGDDEDRCSGLQDLLYMVEMDALLLFPLGIPFGVRFSVLLHKWCLLCVSPL